MGKIEEQCEGYQKEFLQKTDEESINQLLQSTQDNDQYVSYISMVGCVMDIFDEECWM